MRLVECQPHEGFIGSRLDRHFVATLAAFATLDNFDLTGEPRLAAGLAL